MLLFSNEFISLVLMTLMIGGELHSAEGVLKNCFECIGDGADVSKYVCNAEHEGRTQPCHAERSNACAMIKEGDKILKMCEEDISKWSDNGKADGKPICIKNEKCYCNNENFCNKDKNFGFEPVKEGSVGIKVISPAMCVLSMIVAAWMYHISSN
ncbi:hypothetical protein Ocin01_15908 [Orchesella cincta]|uniref:Uncharacterized protein n=1 Tax=Orchesella cincta TaxID=48709 RepID=A0A1D2MCX7_ORCCI|nr:hypothetical protein Ocin01_15908 [Orchesella cincta]